MCCFQEIGESGLLDQWVIIRIGSFLVHTPLGAWPGVGTTQPCTSLPVTFSQVMTPNMWNAVINIWWVRLSLMITDESVLWGRKTTVRKKNKSSQMVTGFRAFFGFLHKLLQKQNIQGPKLVIFDDSMWNVGFTKSVLKSLNLIFSHLNFLHKIRKGNVSVNILFYYFPNFLIFWKIAFHLFCLDKVWKGF